MPSGAWGPAPINFGALGDIGQSLGGAFKQWQSKSRLKDAFERASKDGMTDYNLLATELFRMGDTEGAATALQFGNAMNGQGMTPYQRESLGLQRERLDMERDAQASGGKPPMGYRWSEGQPGNLEAIPGGPGTRIPAETAGRVAMIDTALADFDSARKVMEGEWGATGAAQSVIGMGEIGRAQRQVKSLIEASLRAMTGAAAPDTEVARYMDLYMPNATDTAATAKQKLDLLTGFAQNAKNTITQGRGMSPTTPMPQPQAQPQAEPSPPAAPRVDMNVLQQRIQAAKAKGATDEQIRRWLMEIGVQ